MFYIVVPGEPRGKGRPRFARRGNFVSTYTPDATAEYEHKIQVCAKEAGAIAEEDCAVVIKLQAGFTIPKSKPKWWKEAVEKGVIPKVSKPDIDNIVKIVLDALNGIAFKDDSQVIAVSCEKFYSVDPMLTIHISYHDFPAKKKDIHDNTDAK